MIHYALRCNVGHEFEGWFRNSGSFDEQVSHGLLSCPHCGTAEVVRGLMAPAVRTRPALMPPPNLPAPQPQPQPGPPVDAVPQPGPSPMPDALRALLQRMRREVERQCDDLGDGFAAEAIRMHRGEVVPRGIYGNASEEDQEALADEGVPVSSIPWLKLSDG